MPAFLIPIGIWLGGIVASLVGRVLLALGIGYATYHGARALLTHLETVVQAHFCDMPADMLHLATTLDLDKALSVIFSAYSVRWSIKAAMGANRKLQALPSK